MCLGLPGIQVKKNIYILHGDNNLAQREFLYVFVHQFFCTVTLSYLSGL